MSAEDGTRVAEVIEGAYVAAEGRYEAMDYRRCGRSGLQVPALSLGLWHNFGHDRPHDTQRAIVRLPAFDLGITHFDLANNYGPPYGSAESQLRQDARRGPAALPRTSWWSPPRRDTTCGPGHAASGDRGSTCWHHWTSRWRGRGSEYVDNSSNSIDSTRTRRSRRRWSQRHRRTFRSRRCTWGSPRTTRSGRGKGRR